MTVVERTGEALARATSRRSFLQRSAVAIFGLAAAGAVSGLKASTAWATACTHTDPGQFCTGYGTCPYPHDCNGGDCNTTYCTYSHGVPWTTSPYGCWCQAKHCYQCGGLGAYCGYWQCCDCICEQHQLCTCQGFVYTCNCGGAADCILCC